MKRSSGIIISYVYMIINMIANIVLSSFLIRTLGDTEYGIYQTMSSFVNYLVILEFGTGTVMTRNISVCSHSSDCKDRSLAINQNYSTIYIITIVLSVLMFIVSIAFYFGIDSIYANTMTTEQLNYGKKMFLFLIGYLIFSYITQSANGFLLAMEQYTFEKVVSLVRILLRVALLIGLILIEQKAIIIAVVDAILGLCILVITLFYAKKHYKVCFSWKLFDKAIFKASIPMCLALLLQTFMNQANSNVDKFVIGIMMSVESVTIYSISQYIYSMASGIMCIPISMYMPEIAKNMTNGVKDFELTKTLIRPCRLNALIGGSIVCGFFAVGKQFISILYGVEKVEAWLYAMVLLIPMFINMTNGVIVNVLDVANKRLTRSLILTGTTVLNIILTVILIKYYGMLGAVIATAIATIIGNVIIMNIYYQKRFNLSILYLFKESYHGILLYQVIAGICTFFVTKMIENHIMSFMVGVCVYLAISFGMIYYLGFNESERKRVIDLLLKIKRTLKRGNT